MAKAPLRLPASPACRASTGIKGQFEVGDLLLLFLLVLLPLPLLLLLLPPLCEPLFEGLVVPTLRVPLVDELDELLESLSEGPARSKPMRPPFGCTQTPSGPLTIPFGQGCDVV